MCFDFYVLMILYLKIITPFCVKKRTNEWCKNYSIYSINTLLGIVLRIYLGKSPGCPGPQLAAVDILCILCIPQPSPATTHSSRSAPPPSYNITAPDAVTSSHRPARLASQLGFYILLLLDIQKYLPTKWWRVVQSVISSHWSGFVEKPIDLWALFFKHYYS